MFYRIEIKSKYSTLSTFAAYKTELEAITSALIAAKNMGNILSVEVAESLDHRNPNEGKVVFFSYNDSSMRVVV